MRMPSKNESPLIYYGYGIFEDQNSESINNKRKKTYIGMII